MKIDVMIDLFPLDINQSSLFKYQAVPAPEHGSGHEHPLASRRHALDGEWLDTGHPLQSPRTLVFSKKFAKVWNKALHEFYINWSTSTQKVWISIFWVGEWGFAYYQWTHVSSIGLIQSHTGDQTFMFVLGPLSTYLSTTCQKMWELTLHKKQFWWNILWRSPCGDFPRHFSQGFPSRMTIGMLIESIAGILRVLLPR